MVTFKIRASQTVTWYSTKTGRKMVPSTRLLPAVEIEADSKEAAIEQFKALQETRVTTGQKRDLSHSGAIYTMDNGKILATDKF